MSEKQQKELTEKELKEQTQKRMQEYEEAMQEIMGREFKFDFKTKLCIGLNFIAVFIYGLAFGLSNQSLCAILIMSVGLAALIYFTLELFRCDAKMFKIRAIHDFLSATAKAGVIITDEQNNPLNKEKSHENV